MHNLQNNNDLKQEHIALIYFLWSRTFDKNINVFKHNNRLKTLYNITSH